MRRLLPITLLAACGPEPLAAVPAEDEEPLPECIEVEWEAAAPKDASEQLLLLADGTMVVVSSWDGGTVQEVGVSGELGWKLSLDPDGLRQATAVAPLPEGGLVLAQFENEGGPWLSFASADGELEATHALETGGDGAFVYSIVPDDDGGLTSFGAVDDPDDEWGYQDSWIGHTNAGVELEWSRHGDLDRTHFGRSVATAGGYFSLLQSPGIDAGATMVGKVSSDGAVLWEVGTAGWNAIAGIAGTASIAEVDGRAVVAGDRSAGSYGVFEAFLTMFDETGELAWDVSLPEARHGWATYAPGWGVLAIGMLQSQADDSRMLVWGHEEDGTRFCENTILVRGASRLRPTSLVVDDSKTVGILAHWYDDGEAGDWMARGRLLD